MNKQELDIMLALSKAAYHNQRSLSEQTGYSLGLINRCLRNLMKAEYLDKEMRFTELANSVFAMRAPQNAIILAAGFGMRTAPINMETPKALLEVRGEKLIERLIRQLHEVGIHEIYVVVGFMKESFEYLIDEFHVKLIVNAEYAVKNNLHSLHLALTYISNSYILPCDLWCAENPFRDKELYSWYMVDGLWKRESAVRVNRKMELVRTQAEESGNAMIGISYILKEDAADIKKRIEEYCKERKYDNAFWEEILYQNDRMMIYPRVVSDFDIVEINTYEQLQELKLSSAQRKSNIISVAAAALCVEENKIVEISIIKKGITNHSFSFSCEGKKYIMRIPREGTECSNNRREEAVVYQKINGKNICDEVIYINAENGYKIAEYIEGTRECDLHCENDIRKCMKKLREFHEMELSVSHEFDIWEQIAFYESLWEGMPSSYKDYCQTKEKVLSLRPFIENHIEQKVLTHIDAVPDNFLFVPDENGKEDIRIIDWEYAGMQDPHVDIAMFCIYSFYDKEQVDHLIDLYFTEGCKKVIRCKIYCYIAACGLLWSNWCEYKRRLGVEFGEYSLRQYRYAKEYYKIFCEEQSMQNISIKLEEQAGLSELQFHILKELMVNKGKTIDEETLSGKYKTSLMEIKRQLSELTEKNYITSNMQITQAGRKAMEPFRVENAVIMAAGMSSRFAPLSYEMPKALLKVRGELLIEREIEQLKEAGIHNIIVVVGYMKEKLFYLADKYHVEIVVNEDYYRYNNTSTLMPVAERLRNTYICSSDNYFTENPFEQYVYRAYYSAVYASGKTNEYCISCNERGRIEAVSIGGENAWYMLGHVYFDRAFSEKFVSIFKREYENQITKEHLWEDLYIKHINELDLYIRKYDEKVIKEFDSLEELRLFDENYFENSESMIMQNICHMLDCVEADIIDIVPVASELTDLSFCFSCKGENYVYHHSENAEQAYIHKAKKHSYRG